MLFREALKLGCVHRLQFKDLESTQSSDDPCFSCGLGMAGSLEPAAPQLDSRGGLPGGVLGTSRITQHFSSGFSVISFSPVFSLPLSLSLSLSLELHLSPLPLSLFLSRSLSLSLSLSVPTCPGTSVSLSLSLSLYLSLSLSISLSLSLFLSHSASRDCPRRHQPAGQRIGGHLSRSVMHPQAPDPIAATLDFSGMGYTLPHERTHDILGEACSRSRHFISTYQCGFSVHAAWGTDVSQGMQLFLTRCARRRGLEWYVGSPKSQPWPA